MIDDEVAAELIVANLASSDDEGTPAQTPAVVGIGASAGGLKAFTEFLEQMPPDSGFAFVLIQHLDPHHPSLLPELLASHTTMSVCAVADQMRIAANGVYLIPPNMALTIIDGFLCLEPPTETHGFRLPIDHFFRSLALDQGSRATGIVLSGTGTDGTDGLVAILAHGGLTIAQSPSSAAYPAMPQSAINRGVVDYILPVAEMPALLFASAARATTPLLAAAPEALLSVEMLRKITNLLQQTTGHDFSQYKRTTLQRRIDRRRQLLQLDNLEAYCTMLETDRSEVERLFQDLLISVTDFFRDPVAFEMLSSDVLQNLLRGRDPNIPLRVWVPGCATGEEAYSIAILLQEQLLQLDHPPLVQLFATAIDETALSLARRGHYSASIVDHITPERLARWFVSDSQGYQVVKAIRELCLFSLHNLISDPPFGRMDLIACRNLLIYFDVELQRKLIPVFHYALAPGGYLFLGSAESANGANDAGELFRVINEASRIYQRKERLIRPNTEQPWMVTERKVPRQVGSVSRSGALEVLDLGATLERMILRDYAPTVVAIDKQGVIVYLSGRTYPFLNVPTGTPTANLIALVHPNIQMPLQSAIHMVIQENRAVVREDLTVNTPEGLQAFTLTVRPHIETNGESGLLLVIMQAIGSPKPLNQTTNRSLITMPTFLAQELQRTRDTLEATIVELQASNLDLTLTNEELRSLNEEFQAANEELQTSKEEIQSINEELQTVNAELSRKIEELDRANADLKNLFASTQIPAIFLHADGRIARFTPQANELFALIESDIGRPITDLNARFTDNNLQPLIDRVLALHKLIEIVVHRPEQNRWWRVQIRPYHTLNDKVDGVVLTFIDITTLKRAEAVLQNAHDEMEQRVAARTQELADANTKLQVQIAERAVIEQSRQQVLQQLVTAQEEERRHIARELHDQLGQDLTALILGLKALQDSITADDQITERIGQLQAMAMQIGQEVRSLSVQLRPSVLDDLGLELALSNYIEQWSSRAHVAADLHTQGLEEERLPLAVETTLYRLVQEALTNVLKHAGASEISVIIERQPDEVRLIVEDDGRGFTDAPISSEPKNASQLGLIGMQERVALLNGTLTVESALGSGTTIFARIPLSNE